MNFFQTKLTNPNLLNSSVHLRYFVMTSTLSATELYFSWNDGSTSFSNRCAS